MSIRTLEELYEKQLGKWLYVGGPRNGELEPLTSMVSTKRTGYRTMTVENSFGAKVHESLQTDEAITLALLSLLD